jgi:hypothetical protein
MRLLVQHTSEYIKSIAFFKYLRSENFKTDIFKTMGNAGLLLNELVDSRGRKAIDVIFDEQKK